MGRLYIAEQKGIEGFVKIVALKRILPHLAGNRHFRDMFFTEARVAARLEHPNIVATYELGEVDGTYFISMEYLPGEDLAAILSRCQSGQPMPLGIAASLIQQMANALQYAHELRDASGRPLGLVHRDVNPLNIFVTYHGVGKLLDFGVVKRKSSDTKTAPGIFKGKYGYCAPEQLEGGHVDRCTDLFSLGIVLWECLTGRRLFTGSTDAHTMDAVRSRKIIPPSALRPEVPAELDEIAVRALRRDRHLRYQNGQEMSEDLDRFLIQGEHRPTAKSIGEWLEGLFGAQRASLKIGRGSAVERALARLPPLRARRDDPGSVSTPNIRPRTLPTYEPVPSQRQGQGHPSQPPRQEVQWTAADFGASMNDGGADAAVDVSMDGMGAGPSARTPFEKRLKFLAVGAALAAVAVVGVSLRGEGGGPAAEDMALAATTGTLDIRSEPPGAHIFVDGNPSGLTTPAVLTGVKVGPTVEVRLDRTGFEPAVQRTEVRAGVTRPLSFRLVEAAGTLRLEGVPSRASVFIDDSLVDWSRPLLVPVGPHKIRIETANDVILSKSIVVETGEQTIQVRPPNRGQGDQQQ
jgi:serine/threonine-protein kinase